ncbi:universal stress protein [Rubrivirga sp. IMCC43871]|uniref:universal stress protein n=1 Tax=Rubrivirga sp. IMCC43871 TaxID=3391575 RepID=UPI00398FA98D
MPPIQTVLCAFDGSAHARGALVVAADLAERVSATLHLIHVNPLFRGAKSIEDDGAPQSAQTVASVDAALGAEHAFEVLAPVVHRAHGQTPADGIRRTAEEVGADVVVVGTRGRRGLERLLAGSVAAEVVRDSGVPVLVVAGQGAHAELGPEAPVLIGVDLADPSSHVVAFGRAFAAIYHAPLALATVRDAAPDRLVASGTHRRPLAPAPERLSREAAHAALAAFAAEAGAEDAERHVVPGPPAEALTALAARDRAGLLVVGTHGRHGWGRLRLGSVAEGVVREAGCPVLVVPSAQEPSGDGA